MRLILLLHNRMPRYRSRTRSPPARIRKKGNLTIIEGIYQPSKDEDKKMYKGKEI